jgi:hypothetical protein
MKTHEMNVSHRMTETKDHFFGLDNFRIAALLRNIAEKLEKAEDNKSVRATAQKIEMTVISEHNKYQRKLLKLHFVEST